MKRYLFWIPCVTWVLIVLGLLIYKFQGISYPVVEWKRIVDIGLLIGIPVLLFEICSLLSNFKRKSVIKRCLQIFLVSFAILISLIDFFLLSIIGVYSSTKDADNYLIPDRDVVFDPMIYSVFPRDLQKTESFDYWYIRGKSWMFFDGNGWRVALSATYETDQYALEINRLQNTGLLASTQKSTDSNNEYSVFVHDQDSVEIYVMVSEKSRRIIYYAQYLDLARHSKEDVISELINKSP